MVVRLYAVAFIAFASLLLGGYGIALAADDYSNPQSDDSYSTPDAEEQPAAPDDGAQPSDKLLHMEGLYEIVVRPCLDPLDPLFPLAAGRQDQDRHRSSRLAPAPEDREAIHRRQAKIAQDSVEILALAAVMRHFAVALFLRDESCGLERGRDHPGELVVVFRNQDAHQGMTTGLPVRAE